MGGEIMRSYYADIIKKGDFDKLDTSIDDASIDAIISAMYELYDDESILTYFSCIYMLSKNISTNSRAKLNSMASFLLSMNLNFVEDAYTLAFYHINKAISYDNSNIEYKKLALGMFTNNPHFDMPEKTIVDLANQIISIEPDNEIALRYIKIAKNTFEGQ